MPPQSGPEPGESEATHHRAPAVVCGTEAGRVSAGLDRGILLIRVESEPAGEDIVSCIRQAREAGLLGNGSDTLIDLTCFQGVVDWCAIRAVRDMAPWGQGWSYPARVAYVSTDRMFGALVRVLATLFSASRHRLFDNHRDALAWLNEAPP